MRQTTRKPLASIRLTLMLAMCIFAAAISIMPVRAAEFRAFWVDAFHDGFKSPAQVDQLLQDVRSANCNAVVCQMRRRGDTYYPSPYEPFAADADPNFDALAYLIERAHNGSPRIEVHAWLNTLPVWNDSTSPPPDPNHPFNRYPQYLTKNSTGAMWDGSNYSFDPGHPGALEYVTNLYLDVVSRYDVDGIHFDYARFASGGTWGYNDVSVARYNARYGTTGQPNPGDDRWEQWRRDQVTALVRKVYAKSIAIRPNIKVSAATITWSSGPSDLNSWYNSAAYSSVFQDWRSWMEEGILDINMPMCYYREWQYPGFYDSWISFAKDHKYGRHVAIGPGIYLNSIADSITQLREVRLPGYEGGTADGMICYSYATSNSQGLPFSEFAYALTQPSAYDPNPTPIFASPTNVPPMPWKTDPSAPGHLMGNVTENGVWADGAQVSITGPVSRTMVADGTGFFAFIGLPTGNYDVTVIHRGTSQTKQASVSAHVVSRVDFDFLTPTPVISNLWVSNATTSSFRVNWTTDVPSSSQVLYGTTRDLGSATAEDPAPVTSHSVTVIGLNALTAYYFQAVSRGQIGPPAYSEILCTLTAGQPEPGYEVIVDNPQGIATPSASWSTRTDGNKYGSDYRRCSTAVGGTATFVWRPNLARAGKYEVMLWYPTGSNRSNVAPFTLYYSGGSTSKYVDQTQEGSGWETNANLANITLTPAGGVQCEAGTGAYVLLSNDAPANKNVAADAVRFRLITDNAPPSVPINVRASGATMSKITVSWDASIDASGVAGYAIYKNGVMIAATQGTSYTDTGLMANKSYSYSVSAYDVYGNTSAQSEQTNLCTLSVPPTTETVRASQLPGTWVPTPEVSFTAVGGFGVGKVAYYKVAWDQSPTHVWTDTEATWVSEVTTEQLSAGSAGWYFHVRGYNNAGVPNGTLDLGPFYYDDTPPEMPLVIDDGMYSANDAAFHAAWSASDAESGIAAYSYALGTSPGANDLVDWTETEADSVVVTVPGQPIGTTCYFTVKARNRAGMWGTQASSDGIKVAHAVSRVAEAKAFSDGEPVVFLAEKPITAAYDDFFYVQEYDRSAGIRVQAPGGVQDRFALIAGILGVYGGERVLHTTEVSIGTVCSVPEPVSLINRAIGGADCGPNPGVTGDIGLNNLGLLVRTTGYVSGAGEGIFFIDDGSGAPVKVYSLQVPSNGDFVSVTGVAAAELVGQNRIRVLRTRSSMDLLKVK